MQDVELKSKQSSSQGHVLNLCFLAKFQALPQKLCQYHYSFPRKTAPGINQHFFKEGNLKIFKGSKILDEARTCTLSDGIVSPYFM